MYICGICNGSNLEHNSFFNINRSREKNIIDSINLFEDLEAAGKVNCVLSLLDAQGHLQIK